MAFSLLLVSTPFQSESWHALGQVHRFTHWNVREVESGNYVHENRWDNVNLLSYTTPPVFEDGVDYVVEIVHVDSFNYESEPAFIFVGPEHPVTGVAPARKAWAFTWEGHVFYVLNSSTKGTVLYDVATGQWCRWETQGFPFWNMHRGIMWRGRVLGIDAAGAKVWQLDPSTATDGAGEHIRRVVTGFLPHRGSQNVRQGFMRLATRRQTDPADGATVSMRFSDDGGKTWSRTFSVALPTDKATKRLEFRSLGRIRAPGRIWEIVDTGGLVRIDSADTETDGPQQED